MVEHGVCNEYVRVQRLHSTVFSIDQSPINLYILNVSEEVLTNSVYWLCKTKTRVITDSSIFHFFR